MLRALRGRVDGRRGAAAYRDGNEARSHYGDPLDERFEGAAPNNIWPADRSWMVFTDYDLWATKVSGSHALIADLLNEPELEAIQTVWTLDP